MWRFDSCLVKYQIKWVYHYADDINFTLFSAVNHLYIYESDSNSAETDFFSVYDGHG